MHLEDERTMRQLLTYAAELGAISALIRVGKLKPYLKKSEAFRLYGRANIERWIDRDLLKPRKDGNDSAAWRISRLELASVAMAWELLPWM
jgi:hypothetical protein